MPFMPSPGKAHCEIGFTNKHVMFQLAIDAMYSMESIATLNLILSSLLKFSAYPFRVLIIPRIGKFQCCPLIKIVIQNCP